ncbi:hypothetical protein BX600DRAFT_462019 [Xylariales sp. PMI_506]|nr:hypothetical protein BX600DRAFT_462019 [Xylariales sp. PMI_506]
MLNTAMPRDNPPSIRLACDRCHRQRLRCQRQEGQGSCTRCSRLSEACVFSPRQRRTARPKASEDAGLDLDLDFLSNDEPLETPVLPSSTTQLEPILATETQFPTSDWTALLGFGLPPDLAVNFGDFNATNSTEPELPKAQVPSNTGGSIEPVSLLEYVRQLADLNVQLFEHATVLPPVTGLRSSKLPSPEGRVFAIDNTFRMTQNLIDILKHLYQRSGVGLVPDQGTLLLILSCSNRVFDIYEVIFGHMRNCIEHNITPVTSDGNTFLLPQLRIGSYAPPMLPALAMQMLMIVMMASELFDQLQEALGFWRDNRSTLQSSHERCEALDAPISSRSQFPQFDEQAKSEMLRRVGSVKTEIVTMRQLLLSLPAMLGTGSLQNLMKGSLG